MLRIQSCLRESRRRRCPRWHTGLLVAAIAGVGCLVQAASASAAGAAVDQVPMAPLPLVQVFTLLFLMLGPFKIIGPFARVTKGVDAALTRRIALRATLFASLALLVAAFLGERSKNILLRIELRYFMPPTNQYNTYQSPLSERYASKEMCAVFSDQYKFSTWRRLWIALAEAQEELGLEAITSDQIDEMRRFQDTINFEVARQYERKLRHDVMSHIHAYGEQCPKAMPIIHLGATSAYVQDNTDLIQMREGLRIIFAKLINIVNTLSSQAIKYKDLATLSFTHFQPAQPTTLGKRICLRIQDDLLDIEEVDLRITGLRLHGVKGTTGTQASFMALFHNDTEKVKRFDELVTKKMGFHGYYPVTGQTYSRKIDSQIVFGLAGIAQSSQKFSNNMRLLQH